MATRRPLVLAGGELQQLQPGNGLIDGSGNPIGTPGVANFKPLVINPSGELEQLQPGDTLVDGSGNPIAGSGGSGFAETFSLNMKASESNAAPADASAFALALAQSDPNAAQTEAASLGFPANDFSESKPTPTENFSYLINIWASGSSGTSNVTNPSNADGANNGTVSSQQTAPAGAATSILTCPIGPNVPSSVVIGAGYFFNGYYSLATTLATSVCSVVAHSSTGLFSDITIETLSAAAGSANHLTIPFQFNLKSAGVNTVAKLQTLQIIFTTTDAAAGVTPAVITVDALNVSPHLSL